jgi:hypothetical protein
MTNARFLLVLLLGVVVGCGGEPETPTTDVGTVDPTGAMEESAASQQEPAAIEPARTPPAANDAVPVSTTPAALFSEAASGTFDKQPVKVSGTVKKVGEEFPGQTYVLLESPGQLTGLMCRFSGDTQPWATVIPGQEVTIQGVCHVLGGQPVVESSRFVSVASAAPTVAASELAQKLIADRDAVWEAWRHKAVVVEGTVEGVREQGSAKVVTLAGTPEMSIQCWFLSANKAQVDPLKAGDTVKIVGHFQYEPEDGSSEFSLNDCLLITQPAAVAE